MLPFRATLTQFDLPLCASSPSDFLPLGHLSCPEIEQIFYFNVLMLHNLINTKLGVPCIIETLGCVESYHLVMVSLILGGCNWAHGHVLDKNIAELNLNMVVGFYGF